MSKALKDLQNQYQFLTYGIHHLYHWVRETEDLIADGDEERAKDHIARIEQECEQEEATLAAAFNLFKPPGKDVLSEKEVKYMLNYLGFPSGQSDVDKLLSAIDTDGDRLMSLVEFMSYVGKMGGSFKLFEVRRASLKTTGGADDLDLKSSELKINLLEAGISEQAQAYWRVVVPPSELIAASQMASCQREAIRHIRTLAKSNHEAVMPLLQQRCQAFLVVLPGIAQRRLATTW
jgi:Ca2+-binding EF-hand superfamily protein